MNALRQAAEAAELDRIKRDERARLARAQHAASELGALASSVDPIELAEQICALSSDVDDATLDQLWSRFMPIPWFRATHTIFHVRGKSRLLGPNYREREPIEVMLVGSQAFVALDGRMWETGHRPTMSEYLTTDELWVRATSDRSFRLGRRDRGRRLVLNALEVKPAVAHRGHKFSVLSCMQGADMEAPPRPTDISEGS